MKTWLGSSILFIFLIKEIQLCNPSTLEGCLVEDQQSTNILLSGKSGYGYGFWSQYLSTDYSLETNKFFVENFEGLLLVAELGGINKTLRMIYYQDWTNNNNNQEKYLIQSFIINKSLSQYTKYIFDSFTFDGKWIYSYIGCEFPYKRQIFLYDSSKHYYSGTTYKLDLDLSTESVYILLKAKFSITINSVQKLYIKYRGRISNLQINPSSSGFIFTSASQFKSFLDKQFRPQPFCQLQTYDSQMIQDYKYLYGLIQLESWIKINYNLNVNYSASAFGIDMFFDSQNNYYQKLIDLQYCIVQAWKRNSTNGIYFQTYYQKYPEFTADFGQFLYNQSFDFYTLDQDLRQWQYVSILYGFDESQIPISKLKMWFSDGSVYDVEYNNRTFHFDGIKVRIRNGKTYGSESNGIYFTTQDSRITICIPQSYETKKKCHFSCLDCNGPFFDECLSCDSQSNRYIENNQCKCNLGFIETIDGNCIVLQQLYLNSIQKYIPKNQKFSKFGFFPIQQVDQSVIYLLCPQFNQNYDKIKCIECLSEPESFTKSLKCKSDYVFNEQGQYQIVKRSEKDIELYHLDIETSSMTLCEGCQSFCDPIITQGCHLNSLLLVYITCLPTFYYEEGQCKQCNQNCLTCNNFDICISCHNLMALDPQTNTCLECPKFCQECEYSNGLFCNKCIEKYSLFEGQCQSCGKNCLMCLYIKDEFDGSYFNKCIRCLDNTKYYLSLNGIDCLENLDVNCKFKIQFHKSWFVRRYVSTILHKFQRGDYSSNEIINYCALCSQGYGTNLQGDCILISEIEGLDENKKNYCTILFMKEDNYNFEFDKIDQACIEEILTDDIYLTKYNTNCQELIPNCVTCQSNHCIVCYPGYFDDIQYGSCLPCPEELNCYRCQQTSKIWKNGWKVNYKLYYQTFKAVNYHVDLFGNEKSDEFEIECQSCTTEYEFYQEKCIKKCPENCELCDKVNGQNECVRCKIYEGKRLSLYEGSCIDCPRYCQICKPKTVIELQRINPYFQNEKVISSTHTCLMLQVGLNSQDFYYNTQFQQFLKIGFTEVDPNQIILKFNLYCSLDQFNQDYAQAINKQQFLNENVKMEELFTNNKSQSNFGRIENLNLYTYLSIQQIQVVELEFSLIQDCFLSTHSYIFTTLTQNIYFINSAKLTIEGNGFNLHLKSNLEIFNFDQISINNLIIKPFQTTYLNLLSLSLLEVTLQSVIIQPNQEELILIDFTIQLQNLKQCVISNFTLLNLTLYSVKSFLQIEYSSIPNNINLEFDSFTIQNSNIKYSNIIKLEDFSQEKITLQMRNILINNSNFEFSTIFTTMNQDYLNISAAISQITIYSSQFQNVQPFILTYFIKDLSINQVVLIDSTFINFTLVQATTLHNSSNYYIKSCNFKNSSIISSVQNQQFQQVILENFQVTDVQNDLITILINLTSTEENSITLIQGLVLDTVTLYIDDLVILDQQQIQSIIVIQSDFIQISNVQIIRSKNIAEFSLSSATNLILDNFSINLNPQYFFQSILTDDYCSKQNDYQKYRSCLLIQDVQHLKIRNVSIQNLIVLNSPIIQIKSIPTSVIMRSETIMIENLEVNSCIIQRNQISNPFSIIIIFSQQQLEIIIKDASFTDNIYYSSIKQQESQSALALAIISYYSKVKLDNCKFIQNYVSQSQNSIIYINTEELIIINSVFISNNRMFATFLKHIDWKFTAKYLTIKQVESQFPTFSQSGNGILLASKIILRNITLQNSYSISAGCFQITLKNEAEMLIQNSAFENINTEISEEQSYGGCLYIIDQTDSIKIEMENSIYKQIFGTAQGGVIFLRPNTQKVIFNLTNLTVIDTYSNEGNIVMLNFLNLNQQFFMQNCIILQTLEGYLTFKSKFSSIKQYETSMITITSGNLILKGIFVKLCFTSLLQLTFSIKVSLTQIEIDNSYYYQSPIIFVSFSPDLISKIEINDLQVKNFRQYEQNEITNQFEILVPIDETVILTQNCSNKDHISLKNQTYKIIKQQDLIVLPQSSIQSLIKITNVKVSDQILLQSCSFVNNQCSDCQKGMISISLNEEQQDNIILQNILIMDNSCGLNGCLHFFNEFKATTIIQGYQVKIDAMICIRNNATIGGCIASNQIGLKVSKSIISENQAFSQGGGIYYEGDSTNLNIQNNMIDSNHAQEGGAIFLGSSSLPELYKTQNSLMNNTASVYGNISSSKPNQLTIRYRNLQYQTFTLNQLDNRHAYLKMFSNTQEESVLFLPSGQMINTYQYFNISSQEYQHLNLKFRVVALNQLNEQQFNLYNSECFIESGYKNGNSEIVYTNNFTSYYQKFFDQYSQDYNFDDLILYFGNTQNDQYLILKIYCNSILLPIYNDQFPFNIIGYNSKYFLFLSIQTLPCQLGEYAHPNDNSCHLCEIEKKLYSVTQNATFCKYMDEEKLISIKPAQLQLKYGYWRPFIDSEVIELCQNRIENCLGGWKQGDKTCNIGQIGACCESCDQYNSQGYGRYSFKNFYQCQKCDDQSSQIFYIIMIVLWNLFSIYLTTSGTQNMILELQKNKFGTRQLLINNNKQTGPLMKMFTNYIQIVAIILNFNVEIPQNFKSSFNIFGQSQQMLILSTDCLLAEYFQQGLIYVKIIFSIICPVFYGLIFLIIYQILHLLNMIVYNHVILTTCVLYLFSYSQIQLIQSLIASLSYRTLSNVNWIQADLAYKFDAPIHQQFLPYLIFLSILIGAIVPCILLVSLVRNKVQLQQNRIRKQLGYLFLEYQPKAYYWETFRIFSRETIIIVTTFYQDNLVIKCALMFFIIFAYFQTTFMVLPFQTKLLNNLEQRSSLYCTFSLLVVFALSSNSEFQIILLFCLIIPNVHIFVSFIFNLIKIYLLSYEASIDKFKDILREKWKMKIKYKKNLQKWLVNRGQKRKLIIERFQRIKKQIQIEKKNSYLSFKQKNPSLSTLNDNYNLVLLRPQPILSTTVEISSNSDPYMKFMKRLVNIEQNKQQQ